MTSGNIPVRRKPAEQGQKQGAWLSKAVKKIHSMNPGELFNSPASQF
jgi:hypothetical protein